MDLPSPFGRYFLIEQLATGGMAEIFKAKLVGVEGFEKVLVIKRILPFWSERQDFVAMLVDEAKVLVHLNHPNIVQVYELGRVGPTYFIAMEYVEGKDLRHLVRKLRGKDQELPQEIAAGIVIESLQGLHYAHERTLPDHGYLEIVHRDISPQNILLGVGGEVKVSDFGIAKAVTQTHETQTGVLKGKYAYMSPEQALGRGLDRRSDLFSVGILLYELLMGQRLFAGTNDLETLERVRRAEIPWPEEPTRRLLPGMQDVLRKALARQREGRYQTAEEFSEAIEVCLPKGRRLSHRKMAQFFQGVFGEEIKNRRQPANSQTPQGTRKTAISPAQQVQTVSLVEAPEEAKTLPSGRNRALFFKNPSKRGIRALPILLGILWLGLAGGLAWWVVPRFFAKPQAPESIPAQGEASPAPPLAQVPETQERAPPRQSPATPPAPGVPPKGSLELNVRPAQAQITALTGDQEKRATGKLKLTELPEGTEVQLRVSHKGYENYSQKIEITSDQLNVTRDIQLKKVVPQFGGLRVNAVPWGRVTVPGLIGGRETPVVRGKVPVGRYSIRVSNPSVGNTVSTRVSIRPGRTTVCTADFDGKSQIRCR